MSTVGHLLSRFVFGDIVALYLHDGHTGTAGLWLIPVALESKVAPRRPWLTAPESTRLPGPPRPAWSVESLVQLKLTTDAAPAGFAQGRTMRNAGAPGTLRYEGQRLARQGDETIVTTTLRHAGGALCEHRLSYREGDRALRVRTLVRNDGPGPLTLELLSSFSLGGITPFAHDDAPDRLVVHRLRSSWTAEARLAGETVEDLQLERDWIRHRAVCERFGQLGTMPVRGFAPFVAVEDTGAGVVWGAQIAWAGSWQLEVYRREDCLSLSGGLVDREFGHWTKTLRPGEQFQGPEAVLSVVQGDVDALCGHLTAMQERAVALQPAAESDLPICFNEWGTSWGSPSHRSLLALADRLAGTGVTYLVIDAGWFAGQDGEWARGHGDWLPSEALFPEGMAATAAAIRGRGLIPGIWFELETCGPDSAAFARTDLLLARDGLPITAGERRFWDLRNPLAVAYLDERAIGLLERCGFGYLKIDYNETAGVGCDGAESPGEGLRRQIEATYDLFDRIRERLPELVIENCASGGHRLEPSLMARCSLGSFSDAHETPEIPIIAANLHRLIRPRQSLIWAVLRRGDDDRRLVYSLAATFLGRMCLSGDALELDAAQWSLVTRALRPYRAVCPIIKHGTSRRHGPP